KRPALSLRLIGVVESKSALTSRIKRILNRPMPKTAKLGVLGLVVVIVAGCVLLPMVRAKETSVALAGRNAQADQQQRVRELMYILRNHTLSLSLGRTEQWIAAIKELAEIGKPAVPELAAELDRTDRDSVVRAIAFTLRAIGDPRAVPALIRALPKTATRGSDLGMTVHDSNLHAFMVKHHISGREEYPRFGYKRAVREITAALEKITSHSEGKEHIRAAGSDDPEAIKVVQNKRRLAAKHWGDWWSKHRQEFLSEEELDSATIGPREGDPIEAAGIAKFGPPIPSGKEFRLGAVVEMFVPPFHTDFWDSQVYLDLDTGKLLTKFEGGRPASGDLIVYRWYIQAGVDARVNHWFNSDKKRSGYRLKGFDTHVWQIDNSRWKTMEDEIRSEIPLKLGPPNSRPDFFPRNRSGDWPGYDLSDFPATFLFTTREGSAGVLQIIDASENAEGVWIRYRMVKGPGLEARPAVIGTARKGESAGGGGVFGSVTEMTVLRPDAKTNNTIDFDSGRLSTSLGIKYPLSTALREWLRQSGADVVSVITNKRKKTPQLALAGDQMITMPVSSTAWETMTAAQLIDFLARDTAREDVLLKVRVGKRGKRMAVMPRSSSVQSRPPPTLEPVLGPLRKGWQEVRAKLAEDLPRTFLFKTREGGMGILQITGFTGKNKGVRIRYKMVQKGRSEKNDAEIEVEGVQKGLGVVASAGRKFESVEEFVTALVAGSQLLVENINGSITVGGEETRECRIKATIEVKAKNENETRKLMEKVKVQVRQSGKRLSVRVEQPKLRRKQSVKVDFEITVPKKSNLDLHTNNGEIEIADISGEIESKTNNGAIEA
ncbi:MAG: HEAT repeat domain-containing protein, partial [Planctomycetota bacterium]